MEVSFGALALSAIGIVLGGAVGLITAHFQHGWTITAAREAEVREQERQRREERIRPARDFVRVVMESEVRGSQQEDMDDFLDRYGIDSEEMADYFSNLKKRLGMMASRAEIGPVAELAILSAPTRDIEAAVQALKTVSTTFPRNDADLNQPLRTLDDLIDRYVMGQG